MDHRAEKAKSELLGSAELLESLGVKREREGEKGRERERDRFPHHPRQVSLPLQNSYSKVFGIYIIPCIFSHIFIL